MKRKEGLFNFIYLLHNNNHVCIYHAGEWKQWCLIKIYVLIKQQSSFV